MTNSATTEKTTEKKKDTLTSYVKDNEKVQQLKVTYVASKEKTTKVDTIEISHPDLDKMVQPDKDKDAQKKLATLAATAKLVQAARKTEKVE